MVGPSQIISDDELIKTCQTLVECGGKKQAAKKLGLSRSAIQHRVHTAEAKGLFDDKTGTLLKQPSFSVNPLPSEEMPISELLAFRTRQFTQKSIAHQARKLIEIQIKVPGPIGITHFGDPHVDDDGCNIVQLQDDLNTIKATTGMFGANLGDLHNNWVGRLARLYGEQSTSAKQAWQLVEWLINEIPWLYLVGGNHDAWSGAGDPLKWITRSQVGVFEAWGVRLNLRFPSGKQVRINARHDFEGHSMWNPNHGPVKAVKMGWRDHILTCGHKHETGFGPPLKCPATGLISWPLRAAGYKVIDRYASEKGLPDQNISPSITTIIDPQYGDDDPRLITPFLHAQEAAEFLTYKRKKAA